LRRIAYVKNTARLDLANCQFEQYMQICMGDRGFDEFAEFGEELLAEVLEGVVVLVGAAGGVDRGGEGGFGLGWMNTKFTLPLCIQDTNPGVFRARLLANVN